MSEAFHDRESRMLFALPSSIWGSCLRICGRVHTDLWSFTVPFPSNPHGITIKEFFERMSKQLDD